MVTACNKQGCCITDTFYVYPCCDKYADLTFNNTPILGISTNPVVGELFIINGTCQIPSSIEFQNCTFLMGGGAKLEIRIMLMQLLLLAIYLVAVICGMEFIFLRNTAM